MLASLEALHPCVVPPSSPVPPFSSHIPIGNACNHSPVRDLLSNNISFSKLSVTIDGNSFSCFLCAADLVSPVVSGRLPPPRPLAPRFQNRKRSHRGKYSETTKQYFELPLREFPDNISFSRRNLLQRVSAAKILNEGQDFWNRVSESTVPLPGVTFPRELTRGIEVGVAESSP